MNKIDSIGLFGNGFVGAGLIFTFNSIITNIKIFDIDKSRATHTAEEAANCDIVFVAVPTPIDTDDTVYLNYVYSAFNMINDCNTRNDNIVVLKSTVPPGTTAELQKQYPKLNIVFSPEFLTERTSFLDSINPNRIVLSGKQCDIDFVKQLYRQRFHWQPIIETDTMSAEMIKYTSNCYFALKITYMNEIKALCDKIGANFDDVRKGFVADQRITDSHTFVGSDAPDGKAGFSGTCLPKETMALIAFAKKNNAQIETLNAAWNANKTRFRTDCDWEDLEGRAVVKDYKKNRR